MIENGKHFPSIKNDLDVCGHQKLHLNLFCRSLCGVNGETLREHGQVPRF